MLFAGVRGEPVPKQVSAEATNGKLVLLETLRGTAAVNGLQIATLIGSLSRSVALLTVDIEHGRELLIPLHRETVEALDAYDMQHVVIITTAYGKSFTVDGFSGWMRDAISEAGLPLDCKPHGLRKAAGRLLAEAGAAAKMIMPVLGHTTLAEAERYTEEADLAGLAEHAVIRLEGHKANRTAQTTSAGRRSRARAREP